jgi:tryptophanyl-tRNA synthetase
MVTDPARIRRTDPGNPDLCPVYEFHKIYSPQTVQDQVNQDCRTAAIGCIDCKKLVADRMVEQLTPIWDARTKLTQHPSRVEDTVEAGSKRAAAVAGATLHEVNEAMKI